MQIRSRYLRGVIAKVLADLLLALQLCLGTNSRLTVPRPAIALTQLDIRAPTGNHAIKDLLHDLCLLRHLGIRRRGAGLVGERHDSVTDIAVVRHHGLLDELVQLTKSPLDIDPCHAATPSAGTRMRPESNSGRRASRSLVRRTTSRSAESKRPQRSEER